MQIIIPIKIEKQGFLHNKTCLYVNTFILSTFVLTGVLGWVRILLTGHFPCYLIQAGRPNFYFIFGKVNIQKTTYNIEVLK